MTRQQVIKQLLQQQQTEAPAPTQHVLEETAGYLRCIKCGSSVHKRSNEPTFQAFVTGHCLDQACTQPHEGHHSHTLWQKGGKVSCTQCGLSLHLDAQQRVILTAAIKRPCEGAAQAGTPPLTDFLPGTPARHHNKHKRALHPTCPQTRHQHGLHQGGFILPHRSPKLKTPLILHRP